MKSIPLRIQKTIMYIPYANISCIFMWLYNSFFVHKNKCYVIRTLWILLSTAIPFWALYSFLANHGTKIALIFEMLYIYFIPFIIAYRLIKLQKSINIPE